jgi:hypothetical protein
VKYLRWFNQVRLLAESEGLANWESMAIWRDLFLQNLTAGQVLTKVKTDIIKTKVDNF